MRRKTSELPTRIYTYGTRAPTANAETVADQFLKARLYRNRLVEIELTRRTKVRAILNALPAVAPLMEARLKLEEELKAAREALQKAKVAERSRNPKASAERETIKRVLPLLKKLRDEIKEARQGAITPEVKQALAVVEAENRETIKRARATSGLYWGTYLLVEKAAEQFRKGKMDPRFRRWDGSGRIGVQIQRTGKMLGMSVERLLGGVDTRLQVAPVPAYTFARETRRCDRRRAIRTAMKIRVQSDEKDNAIFAEFPLFYHRPLPADGIIKNAWVKRYRIGRRMYHCLQVAVESATFLPKVEPGRPVVAIDIGWRSKRDDDSLRIAYFYDSHGYHGEIRFPDGLKTLLSHPDSLRAIRDRMFNTHRKLLMDFATRYTEEGLSLRTLPAWWSEEFAHLASWKTPVRLAKAALVWREKRFEGDEQIFSVIWAWRKQELHLYDWEANERNQTLAFRKDFYWRLANEFTKKYSVVVIEDFNLNDVAISSPPEGSGEEHEGTDKSRHQRFISSLSEFRQILECSGPKYGAVVVKEDAVRSTMECHLCGYAEAWDAAPRIQHRCEGCGEEWDQDRNAAQNLLHRWQKKNPKGLKMPAAETAETAATGTNGHDLNGTKSSVRPPPPAFSMATIVTTARPSRPTSSVRKAGPGPESRPGPDR